jgi:hypothetical protein
MTTTVILNPRARGGLAAREAPGVLNRLKALEQGFKEAGLRIRYEKGHFQSGYCLFEDQGVVIVNKFYSPAAKIDTLEDITRQILGTWTFLGDPQRESLQRSLEIA